MAVRKHYRTTTVSVQQGGRVSLGKDRTAHNVRCLVACSARGRFARPVRITLLTYTRSDGSRWPGSERKKISASAPSFWAVGNGAACSFRLIRS